MELAHPAVFPCQMSQTVQGETGMKIYDISLTITPGLPVWPGDPQVVLKRVSKMEEGEHNNVSQLALSAHAGTHVDAPYHFIADGETIEKLPLETLVGPAQVVELPAEVTMITADALRQAGIAAGMERVLLKTRNSRYWKQPGLPFQTDFASVSPDGAEYLVACGVRLIGIDYFSIAPFGDSVPTHRVLLGAKLIILEGADLSEVPAGNYQLYCLPLKLGGSDGAPARAILIK
jgi:arylformamidase